MGDKSSEFFNNLIQGIEQKDALHYKKIKNNIIQITKNHKSQFDELLNILCNYFFLQKITPDQLAIDYLKMINDIRKESIYFLKHGVYS
ncbi:MAG: hypothetical protein COS14_00480, partial [Bacteroidetes bacterium CG02_land_8_20_14_3_00_31_25]